METSPPARVSSTGAVDTGSPGTGAPARLTGNLGVVAIVFTVMAFNAPLAVAAGFVPIVIGYGNGNGAPLTFAVIAALLLVFSVGLTAMSRFMHSPGAFYSYVVAGLGRAPGLGGAFTAITAYTSFIICSYAFGGLLTDSLVVGTFNGPDLPWWVWSLVLWVAASSLSLFNIELSAKVLGVALVAEVALTLIWSLRVFADGGPQGVSTQPFTFDAFTSGSLSVGLLFGALCITGFEAVAVFREETKDPVKTVPRATYTAVLVMCTLYGLAAWAYLTSFGDDAVAQAAADPSGSFVASVQTYVGTAAADLVSVLLVTSAFASLLANQNIGARYLYVLGGDAVLPRPLGRVHPRHGSPFIAATVFASIAIVGIVVPAVVGMDPLRVYASMAAIGSVCLLVLMFATSISVVAYFQKDKSHTANLWQSLIAPALAICGLGTVLYLAITNMTSIIGGTQTAANIALGVIAAVGIGGAALALFYRTSRPSIYAKIGRQDI